MNRMAGALGRLNSSPRRGFSPSSLSPYLWLDAGSGVEVTTGTGAADGDTVQRWLDQSGNGAHAIQDTSGSRLQYKTGILNGLPVLRASATKLMRGTLAANVSNENITVVCVANATPDAAARNTLFGLTSTLADNNAQASLYLGLWNPALYRIFKNGTAVNPAAWNAGYSGWHIHSLIVSGTSVTPYRDGVSLTTQTIAGQLLRGFYILGAQAVTTAPLIGDLAELLVFPALSSDDHTNVLTYLSTKYGIAI